MTRTCSIHFIFLLCLFIFSEFLTRNVQALLNYTEEKKVQGLTLKIECLCVYMTVCSSHLKRFCFIDLFGCFKYFSFCSLVLEEEIKISGKRRRSALKSAIKILLPCFYGFCVRIN